MGVAEWLLLGIFITSCVRLWFMIGDRNHVYKMNAHVADMQKDWVAQTAAMRKAELAELAELAKGSDTIREFISEFDLASQIEDED